MNSYRIKIIPARCHVYKLFRARAGLLPTVLFASWLPVQVVRGLLLRHNCPLHLPHPLPSPPSPPPSLCTALPGRGYVVVHPLLGCRLVFWIMSTPRNRLRGGGGGWAGEGAGAPPRWRGSSIGPYGGGLRGPCAQGTSERRFLGLSGNHAVVTGCVGRVEGDCVCHRSCYSVAHARPLFSRPQWSPLFCFAAGC